MLIKQILENAEKYMGKSTCNPTTNVDHKFYWCMCLSVSV